MSTRAMGSEYPDLLSVMRDILSTGLFAHFKMLLWLLMMFERCSGETCQATSQPSYGKEGSATTLFQTNWIKFHLHLSRVDDLD